MAVFPESRPLCADVPHFCLIELRLVAMGPPAAYGWVEGNAGWEVSLTCSTSTQIKGPIIAEWPAVRGAVPGVAQPIDGEVAR